MEVTPHPFFKVMRNYFPILVTTECTLLGDISTEKSALGERLYNRDCLACHHNIKDTTDKQRRIISLLSSIENVGTDPKMAENSVKKMGYTGILQGSYVNARIGTVMLQEKAPVALMVKATTENTLKRQILILIS